MAQIDIDLGSIKGAKGDKGDPGNTIAISGTINAQSTDNEAASAKAVYDLIVAVMEEQY